MVFDPNIPTNGQQFNADPVRQNFNALKYLIDGLPVPEPEADPVFAASEAAKLGAGDKAKLDSAPTMQDVGNAMSYTPANPGYWNSPAPTTIAEAIERLAAAYRALTGNPV